MGYFIRKLRAIWLDMLEPPWHHSGPEKDKADHWLNWLIGWVWTISGLILGALAAPSVLQLVGLSNSPYQDAVDICVAVLAGFLVQFVGWVIMGVIGALFEGIQDFVVIGAQEEPEWLNWLAWMLAALGYMLPLAAVYYLLYRYLTFLGPGQGRVTIAFVGGFLLKAFLIPFIKTIASGIALLWLKTFLRGKKASV